MACSCHGRTVRRFEWTSDPDENGEVASKVYTSEIQAKARVIRDGGSYVELGPNA